MNFINQINEFKLPNFKKSFNGLICKKCNHMCSCEYDKIFHFCDCFKSKFEYPLTLYKMSLEIFRRILSNMDYFDKITKIHQNLQNIKKEDIIKKCDRKHFTKNIKSINDIKMKRPKRSICILNDKTAYEYLIEIILPQIQIILNNIDLKIKYLITYLDNNNKRWHENLFLSYNKILALSDSSRHMFIIGKKHRKKVYKTNVIYKKGYIISLECNIDHLIAEDYKFNDHGNSVFIFLNNKNKWVLFGVRADNVYMHSKLKHRENITDDEYKKMFEFRR